MKIEPTSIDVLFGRGKPTTNHQGNVIFRETVELYYDVYNNGTTNDKNKIAKSVKLQLEFTGARFLQKNESSIEREMEKAAKKSGKSEVKKNAIMDAEWEIPEDSEIVRKIKQAFVNKKQQKKPSVLSENNANKRTCSQTVGSRKKSKTIAQAPPSAFSRCPARSENQFEECLGAIVKEILELAQQNPSAGYQQLTRDFANCHGKETSALHEAVNAMVQQGGSDLEEMERPQYRRASSLEYLKALFSHDSDFADQVEDSPAGLESSRHFQQPEVVSEPRNQRLPLGVPPKKELEVPPRKELTITPASQRVSNLYNNGPNVNHHSVLDQICTNSVTDFLKQANYLSSASLGTTGRTLSSGSINSPKRNFVLNNSSVRAAWARVRLSEQSEAKETTRPSFPGERASSWTHEQKGEQDGVLAMLSEGCQHYLRDILKRAVHCSRERQNIDGIRLWHQQDVSAAQGKENPLSLRLGWDVSRQVAQVAGNSSLTCKRMEEALERRSGVPAGARVLNNSTLEEATSMGDLSLRPQLAKGPADADLQAKRDFEEYGERHASSEPPLGRVPKKAKVEIIDLVHGQTLLHTMGHRAVTSRVSSY